MSDEKNITEQLWLPELRADGVYLIGSDGSPVCKILRPADGSDMFMAGWIVGLQASWVGAKARRK